MRILVLKGASKYNVLRLATDEIVSGFRKMQCEADVVDLTGVRMLDEVTDDFGKYDLIFAMQAVFLDLDDPTEPEALFGRMGIPYIGWIFDDVLLHFPRIENAHYENIALLTVDRLAPDSIRIIFPQSRNVYFFPHGGFPSENRSPKDIEILFPCSMGERKGEEAFGLSTSIEQTMAKGILKLIRKNPLLSPRTALMRLLEMSGIELSDDIMMLFNNVLLYTFYVVEYECKTKLLEGLLESGLKVVSVGEGFDSFVSKYPENLQVLPPTDIQGVVDLINRTKILINPLYPVLEEGFHERIFTAMLNQAVCFTPASVFLQEQLEDRVEFIDLNNTEVFPERVKEVLEHFDDNESRLRLEENYKWALENHTWEQRGKEMVARFRAGDWMLQKA